jgi:hypothetical protein
MPFCEVGAQLCEHAETTPRDHPKETFPWRQCLEVNLHREATARAWGQLRQILGTLYYATTRLSGDSSGRR